MIMNGKYLRFSFFASLLVLLNSCDIFNGDDLIIKMDKTTFEKERRLWNSPGIKNYRFIYEFFNDTGPIGPVEITIKENEDPVIEHQNQYNEYVPFKSISEIYDFLNGTFDFIESVKNGTYDGYEIRSLTLNITYNHQYHYPQEVNFSEGYVEMIDGGGYYYLKITEFIPLD
jgi:hypothetical protein